MPLRAITLTLELLQLRGLTRPPQPCGNPGSWFILGWISNYCKGPVLMDDPAYQRMLALGSFEKHDAAKEGALLPLVCTASSYGSRLEEDSLGAILVTGPLAPAPCPLPFSSLGDRHSRESLSEPSHHCVTTVYGNAPHKTSTCIRFLQKRQSITIADWP